MPRRLFTLAIVSAMVNVMCNLLVNPNAVLSAVLSSYREINDSVKLTILFQEKLFGKQCLHQSGTILYEMWVKCIYIYLRATGQGVGRTVGARYVWEIACDGDKKSGVIHSELAQVRRKKS